MHAGGIKSTNAVRTLFGSITSSGKSLDGLAVISDIVASREPLIAAKRLKDSVSHFKASRTRFSLGDYTTESLKGSVGEALKYVRQFSPLVHQVRFKRINSDRPLTAKEDHQYRCDHTIGERNNCTRRLADNGYISCRNGGSRKNPRGFVDQLWDVDQPRRNDRGWYGPNSSLCFTELTKHQGQYANQNKKPLIFDPVGVGATSFRKLKAAGVFWPQLTLCFKPTPL
jgi:thiamine-phosphate diphosphorylase/hydroxyethylthiazole kinase